MISIDTNSDYSELAPNGWNVRVTRAHGVFWLVLDRLSKNGYILGSHGKKYAEVFDCYAKAQEWSIKVWEDDDDGQSVFTQVVPA